MVSIKTEKDIELLKEGGKRLANVLQEVAKAVKHGVSTADLDKMAHDLIVKSGDRPAFLNYVPDGANRPYPCSMCISVNEEIVHGIGTEDPKIIQDGDIVTLDAGYDHGGLITDAAITVIVGEVDKEVRQLVNTTREALQSGIKEARAGNRIGDISAAIEAQADKNGFHICDGLSGHGVGYDVHEEPFVPNFGRRGEGEVLKPGMVIAIEPMFAIGTHRTKLMRDGYTYVTRDGSISAHFEHTVVITDGDPLVVTKI